MLDIIPCITKGGNEESHQTARRKKNSEFQPTSDGCCATPVEEEQEASPNKAENECA
jgi:hypothetical protein